MAKSIGSLRRPRKRSVRSSRNTDFLSKKLKAGVQYARDHPVIAAAILLVLAGFLFNLLVTQAFSPVFKCDYLIGDKLSLPVICDGKVSVDTNILGIKIKKSAQLLPAFEKILDPQLEKVRKVVAWTTVILLACVSLFVSMVIAFFKTVIELVTLNKETWNRLASSVRMPLLVFVGLCSLFYLAFMR